MAARRLFFSWSRLGLSRAFGPHLSFYAVIEQLVPPRRGRTTGQYNGRAEPGRPAACQLVATKGHAQALPSLNAGAVWH